MYWKQRCRQRTLTQCMAFGMAAGILEGDKATYHVYVHPVQVAGWKLEQAGAAVEESRQRAARHRRVERLKVSCLFGGGLGRLERPVCMSAAALPAIVCCSLQQVVCCSYL